MRRKFYSFDLATREAKISMPGPTLKMAFIRPNRATLLRQPNHPPYGREPPFKWNKGIWDIKTSPKIKTFLWKLLKRALPTGENLQSRGMSIDPRCKICGELETSKHIFLECRFAKACYKEVPLLKSLPMDEARPFEVILEQSDHNPCLPPVRITSTPLTPWILWYLWTSRNQRCFEQRDCTPQEVLNRAIGATKEWQDAQPTNLKSTPRQLTPTVSFSHPLLTTVVVDAAWDEKSKRAGLGWAWSVPLLEVTHHGSSSAENIANPLVAEATALLEDAKQALDRGLTYLHLRNDSQNLVKALTSRQRHKELYGILFDIASLLASATYVSFSFISHLENALADSLAKSALRLSVSDC